MHLLDNPKKTSAPLIASSSVLNFVSIACKDFHSSNPFYLYKYTPLLSHLIFSFLTPEFLNNSAHAIAEAPAPFTTILYFLLISQ